MLDQGLSALFEDLDQRGLLSETLVVALGEFGRSPERGVSTSGNTNSADGRDHWPYCYSSIIAGAGIKQGYVHGESDKTASSPRRTPFIRQNCSQRSTTLSASIRKRLCTTT
jgi:uncharacterized protein (DUF1501 family)